MLSKGSLLFLVLLTGWAQFDAVLLPSAAFFPTALPLGDGSDDSDDTDDQECLPSQRLPQKTEFGKQVIVSRTTRSADFPSVRRNVRRRTDQILPFTPRLLYLFMSLQI